MYICGPWVYTCPQWPLLDPLELELQVVVSSPVLGTEHGSVARIASVLNSWTISPTHFSEIGSHVFQSGLKFSVTEDDLNSWSFCFSLLSAPVTGMHHESVTRASSMLDKHSTKWSIAPAQDSFIHVFGGAVIQFMSLCMLGKCYTPLSQTPASRPWPTNLHCHPKNHTLWTLCLLRGLCFHYKAPQATNGALKHCTGHIPSSVASLSYLDLHFLSIIYWRGLQGTLLKVPMPTYILSFL